MQNSEFRAMIRIAGTTCDGKLPLVQGLRKIDGVGLNFARAIATVLGLSPWSRIGNLSDEQVAKIEEVVRDPIKHGVPTWMFNRRSDPRTGQNLHLFGPDVKITERFDIELQKRIKSWRGVRHSLGLKVRGQRTRTTGRTGTTIGVSRKSIKSKSGGQKS